MKKNIARLIAGLLIVVFALGSVGPAFASANDLHEPTIYPACLATASALTGPAPLTVQFVAHSNNESVAYAWFFGGGEKASGTGNVVSNKYSGVGEYRVRLVCEDGTRGFYNHANLLIITVTPGEDTIQNPGDDGSDNGAGNTGSANQTGVGLTTGDNSPVVNGNGNIVMVIPQEENVPVVQQPQPLEITINVQPDPIVTQKTNIITTFIHATLKATETFFHVLDESWFKPELVK